MSLLQEKGDMFLNRLAVGCGGFIGSVLRYLIGAATSPSSFPLSTLAINVVGSFALAAFAALVLRGAIADGELSLLLRVGLCGGFTTMSMFSLEMVDMVSRGAWAGAVGYAVLTCTLCVAAAFAGGVAVSKMG